MLLPMKAYEAVANANANSHRSKGELDDWNRAAECRDGAEMAVNSPSGSGQAT